MKKLAIITAAVAAFGVTSASAQTAPAYAELNYSFAKIDDGTASAKPKVVGARLGLNYNENIAAELYVGWSGQGDTIDGGKVKVKEAMGLYVKGSMPLGDNAKLIGRVGYLRAKLDLDGLGGETQSDGSLSYGAGLQFNITQQVYGSLDYTSFYDKQGVSVRGPSIGVGLKF